MSKITSKNVSSLVKQEIKIKFTNIIRRNYFHEDFIRFTFILHL